ncbi:hypothetical protein [Spiroplasma sp. DGKH1]|uniref:hypothetical protein n=1 Tax=Spiroplasma sp. DGKH1 TaxID=3050074 RepID=UPI0034C62D81
METVCMALSGIITISFLIASISLMKYLKFRKLKKVFDVLPKKESRKLIVYKISLILFLIIFVISLISFIPLTTL